MTLTEIKVQGFLKALIIMSYCGIVAYFLLVYGLYWWCAIANIIVVYYTWDAWKFATLKGVFIPQEDIDNSISGWGEGNYTVFKVSRRFKK